MAKTIPFSTVFPSYHPEKGNPTFFVQKLWNSILGDAMAKDTFFALEERLYQLNKHLPYCIFQEFRDSILKDRTKMNELDYTFPPKGHTIRSGHRWKEGEMFSPRIWSGRPYGSKQIIIYDDMQVKTLWEFEIKNNLFALDGIEYDGETERHFEVLDTVAKNDGLGRHQLLEWFKFPAPFDGQVICWDEKINYSLI